MDKFSFDDLKKPLYEHSQIVTEDELIGIHNGFILQYKHTHWYQFEIRRNLKILIHFLKHLINWLNTGKPQFPTGGQPHA